MKHLILTLSLILGQATSVVALDKDFDVGDVYRCSMQEAQKWQWDQKEWKLYKLKRFKYSIADGEDGLILKFDRHGGFGDMSIPIIKMLPTRIDAKSEYRHVYIQGNKFSYSQAGSDGTSVVVASCIRH